VVRSLKMPRMSVEELAGLNAQGITPTVIDVREPLLFGQSHIPGASSWLEHQGKGRAAYEHLLPRERHEHGLVVYCDCPTRSPPRAWPGNCSVRDFTMSGHCPVA
jgi:rhodanese-related sulfurtransferase